MGQAWAGGSGQLIMIMEFTSLSVSSSESSLPEESKKSIHWKTNDGTNCFILIKKISQKI